MAVYCDIFSCELRCCSLDAHYENLNTAARSLLLLKLRALLHLLQNIPKTVGKHQPSFSHSSAFCVMEHKSTHYKKAALLAFLYCNF